MIIKSKKKKSRGKKKLDSSWEGALKHLKNKYTSVELQTEINWLRIKKQQKTI